MSNRWPVWAVIPASGIGARMQADVPKQYLKFQNKTIIEHCLDRLLSHPQIDGAMLILNSEDTQWEELAYQSDKPIFLASGGEERFISVLNGLNLLQVRQGDEAMALVHDVVRPLVSHEDITRVIETAYAHEVGAILASPVNNTLKLEDDKHSIAGTVPRDGLWNAYTPQVFQLRTLQHALRESQNDNFVPTDDSSAVERLGFTPALVKGRSDNIKITEPEDLKLAELIWSNQINQ